LKNGINIVSVKNQGRNKQYCYGSNSNNNAMVPKPNNGAERKSNTKTEETEQKDYDMGSPESKTQLSARGQNLVKGPRQDGSNSSNSTLLFKSNNGTAGERNSEREGNKHMEYKLGNLENKELDSSCLRALEKGSSPKDATQMNCKGTQLAKVTKPR
jgi:hypothetical protein